jgi:hypothetical protein
VEEEVKVYLGDGVYAYHDGYMLTLTTNGGAGVNTIHLEPEVLYALDAFRERVEAQRHPPDAEPDPSDLG